MVNDSEKLDIIVYGATGYTGKLAVEYLVKYYGPKSETPLKFGLAGRSLKKLINILEEIEKKEYKNDEKSIKKDEKNPISSSGILKNIKLFEANIDNYESIRTMTSSCRCIVNFVGPYGRYGEPVITACIETSTNYCDITAEYEWVNEMRKKYNEQAKNKNIKIVHFCGLECLPFDVSCILLNEEANRKYQTKCTHYDTIILKLKGAISAGTFFSGLNILQKSNQNIDDIYTFCRNTQTGQLLPGVVTHSSQKCSSFCLKTMCSSSGIKYDCGKYGVTYPHFGEAFSKKIVNWTHLILGESLPAVGTFEYTERISTYPSMPLFIFMNFIYFFIFKPLKYIIVLLLQLPFASTWLNYFNSLASGYALKAPQHPGMEAYVHGRTSPDSSGKTHNVVCKVTMENDPGYVETSGMAVECGITMAVEWDKCPGTVGILPPGAAMSTAIINRLNKIGRIQINIVEENHEDPKEL